MLHMAEIIKAIAENTEIASAFQFTTPNNTVPVANLLRDSAGELSSSIIAMALGFMALALRQN
jgi:hypothetical protein